MFFQLLDAFDTEQLLDCIKKLKCGQSVHVPIYDFKQHRRSSDSFRQVLSLLLSHGHFIFVVITQCWLISFQVNASDVIILEGILVFHDQRVRNLMNMKIFVDTGFNSFSVYLPFNLYCVNVTCSFSLLLAFIIAIMLSLALLLGSRCCLNISPQFLCS